MASVWCKLNVLCHLCFVFQIVRYLKSVIMRLKYLSECYTVRFLHHIRHGAGVSRHYATSKSIKDAKPFKLIPALSSLPVIGPLHHFLPVIGEFKLNINLFDLAVALNKKFGPIIRMSGTFSKGDTVMLFDPEYVEQVFRLQETNPLRYSFETAQYYREILKKDQYEGIYGLTTVQGAKWRDFRTKVNPALLNLKMARVYATELNKIAEDFIERLKLLKDNEAYMMENFNYEVTKWSLESVALVGLGDRLGSLDGELTTDHTASKLMKAAIDIVQTSFQLEILPHPWKYFSTPGYKKLMKAYDVQWDICTTYIGHARKRFEERGHDIPEEDKTIVEKLLAIDERVAVMMANEMLLAGIDTVAFTTISVLYHLATNTEKQERLRKEIRSDDSHKRYLRACIKEAQRVMPAVPATLRRTDRDHVVGGYHIPSGIDVMAPTEILSSMEKFYPRAKEFIPERWLADKSDPLYYGNTHPMVTLPFGFGIRSCVGRRIAELEIETFIKSMIGQFEVTWEGPPIKVVNRITNVFEKPFNFKFKCAK